MMKMVAGASIASILLVGGYFLFKGTAGGSNDSSVRAGYVGSDVRGNTSFACKSLMSADIFPESGSNQIVGSASQGTDSVALTIRDEETLILTTAASVEAGIAEGDEMRILENTNDKLTAIWYNSQVNSVISTIALNKSNGLTVWNKGNTDFAFFGAPSGSVIYMKCL